MGNFPIILLSSTITMGSLYIVYFFLLKNDTFYSFNRSFLYFTILLSFMIPFIPLPYLYHTVPKQQILHDLTNTGNAMIYSEDIVNNSESSINPELFIFILYWIVAGIFSIRFILRFSNICRIIANSRISKKGKIRFVFTKKDISVFSFFNFIFINPDLENKNLKPILLHEKEHIVKYHTFDKLLIELLTCILWINPFIWLIKKSFYELHEFQADTGVISNGHSNTQYIKLIVNQAFGSQFFQLGNNFNYSLTKKRMLMMTKQKSPVYNKLKFLFIIPIGLGLIILFSFTNLTPVIYDGLVSEINSDSKQEKISFIIPLDLNKDVKVTARFEEVIQFNNEKLIHKGIDFQAQKGTKIFAANDGKVVLIKESDEGYGNQILIEHSNDFKTRYAHLDNIWVKEGKNVKKGDIIGSVGNSGKSTGPHLHFEVIKQDKKVNPEEYLDDLILTSATK